LSSRGGGDGANGGWGTRIEHARKKNLWAHPVVNGHAPTTESHYPWGKSLLGEKGKGQMGGGRGGCVGGKNWRGASLQKHVTRGRRRLTLFLPQGWGIPGFFFSQTQGVVGEGERFLRSLFSKKTQNNTVLEVH